MHWNLMKNEYSPSYDDSTIQSFLVDFLEAEKNYFQFFLPISNMLMPLQEHPFCFIAAQEHTFMTFTMFGTFSLSAPYNACHTHIGWIIVSPSAPALTLITKTLTHMVVTIPEESIMLVVVVVIQERGPEGSLVEERTHFRYILPFFPCPSYS